MSSGSEIITSVPSFCGENDCPVGVHLIHYWIEWSGKRATYTVSDTDGDHTQITKRDVPTAADEDRLWGEYARRVARTGVDVLGNYHASRPRKGRQESWQARLRLGILGVVVTARRGGKGEWLHGPSIPENVRSFLCIDPASNWTCIMDRAEFPTLASVVEKATDCKITKARRATYLRFKVEGPPQPVSPRAVRAAARKHLRDLAARAA
jgi:hypothetical protein